MTDKKSKSSKGKAQQSEEVHNVTVEDMGAMPFPGQQQGMPQSQLPPGFPPPQRLEENIGKCQELARRGLVGSIVTVTPEVDGRKIPSFKAVFVEWVRGNIKTEEEKTGRITYGNMTDAVIMRPTGEVLVASPHWLRFDL